MSDDLDVLVLPLFEIESPDRLLLNNPAVIALGRAYGMFEKTGQDLNNFNIHIAEKKQDENGAGEDGADTIEIAFSAKLPSGKKGLGNASKLGRSIMYIASRTTGEILREQGSR